MNRTIIFALSLLPCLPAVSQGIKASNPSDASSVAAYETDSTVLQKSNWKGLDGVDLPNPMTIVDYVSTPLTLTQRRGVLFINQKSSKSMPAENRELVETIAGSSQAELVDQLVARKGKPIILPVDVGVFKQLKDGKLINLPIAKLDPADRILAQQAGQAIFQQQQLLAQAALANGQFRQTTSGSAHRARLLAYLAAGGVLPVGNALPGNVLPGNGFQQGKFEGKFGDQDGPDMPGQAERPGDAD